MEELKRTTAGNMYFETKKPILKMLNNLNLKLIYQIMLLCQKLTNKFIDLKINTKLNFK